MMSVHVDAQRRVRLQASFDVPASRDVVWRSISDFKRMVCTDHFHTAVVFTKGEIHAGGEFNILHKFLGFAVTRRGRILRWKPGHGYAYSDLSIEDPGSAFPHVFFLDLLAKTPTRCNVSVRVAGRWTTRWVPQSLTRLWLWWNLIGLRHGIENAILVDLLRTMGPSTTDEPIDGASAEKTFS